MPSFPSLPFRWVVFIALIILIPLPAAAQAPSAQAPSAPDEPAASLRIDDLPRIIEMLENDQRRADLVKVLKLLTAADAGVGAESPT